MRYINTKSTNEIIPPKPHEIYISHYGALIMNVKNFMELNQDTLLDIQDKIWEAYKKINK